MGIVGIGVGGRLARKKCNGWRIVAALALCHPSLLHISCSPPTTWGRNKHRDQCWVEKLGGEKNPEERGLVGPFPLAWDGGRDREERAAIVQIVQIVEGKQELGEEGRGGCTMQYNLVESAEERDILCSSSSSSSSLDASSCRSVPDAITSLPARSSTQHQEEEDQLFCSGGSSFKMRDFARILKLLFRFSEPEVN